MLKVFLYVYTFCLSFTSLGLHKVYCRLIAADRVELRVMDLLPQ